MSYINRFREYVNLKIFSSKNVVLNTFRVLRLVVAFIALGLLIYSFGFPEQVEGRDIQIFFLKLIFGFYMLNFLVRFIYTFEPRKFFRRTWVEWSILLVILVEAVSELIADYPIVFSLIHTAGSEDLSHWYLLTLQLIMLMLLLVDLTRLGTFLDMVKLKASTLFMLTFMVLILSGTGLLMLPEMTVNGLGASWLEALFTSTSACCVTGLIVVDTATYFTFKGQMVIMVLIQLGGLNIISFATFFASFYSGGVGIRHQTMMQNFFSSESLLDAKGLFRRVITLSLGIEALGAVAIFSLWDPTLEFSSVYEKIYFSVFHSISAFNNAGFSTYTSGLENPATSVSFILHLAFAFLIYFGSIGFSTIEDTLSIKAMRKRMELPWKKLQPNTRVILYSSFVLMTLGTVAFYFLERNNVLGNQNFLESAITSLFTSVSGRTAGFSTVDFGAVSTATLLLFMFLMFIGAAPGSTGGGIKTTTFTLLFLSVYSTIRGKRNIELFRNKIGYGLLNRAFSIFTFFITFIFLFTFILAIIEPDKAMLDLMFEEVSAFATNGLSTGITADLSTGGKLILVISMYIGRVGPLTLAIALSSRVKTVNYDYPKAHYMVG